MPELKHFDGLGMVRFITFCCFRLLPFLNETRAKKLLIEHLNLARAKHKFKLLGYVIMPEHVHLVMHPPDEMKLGLVIREIKSRMAKQYFGPNVNAIKYKRAFWQRRCYDHNCRSAESVREKINYCHNNPVKRGLVQNTGDYKWSSYNWYQGKRDVPLLMDD